MDGKVYCLESCVLFVDFLVCYFRDIKILWKVLVENLVFSGKFMRVLIKKLVVRLEDDIVGTEVILVSWIFDYLMMFVIYFVVCFYLFLMEY